jgi:butyryl-CoA dehydrogenase
MMAVAISEPDAGSAATDLATAAVLDGDEYIVNGVKRWCSGAGHSEFYLTYVRFERTKGASAIGALIIDKDMPGVSFGPQERLMGFRGIPSADMYFDNVRVPADRLVVGPGGFRKLFGAFSIERLGNAAMSLAIGQAALDRTSQYVQEREQFGKQLIDFQMVQATLAEMVIQVEAARLLIQRAARNAGHGAPTALEVSVAKAFSNRMAEQVSEMALKLHGGYGYSIEFGLERLHRDALGWGIAGGTYDMQRLRIVSEYLGRRFDQRR